MGTSRTGRPAPWWRTPLTAGAATLALAATALGAGPASPALAASRKVTITVALATVPPPKAQLAAFERRTGIKVKWVNIDWDSLQTKISAAATAKTYFADATDVDWSRVGQLGKLGWFHPMGDYVDTKALKADVPQLASFTTGGEVVAIPYDSSYMTTTVNSELFTRAGITQMPTTMAEYTTDLQKIKSSGASATPLNIPFAAAEGLSTYWYETTHAFGGTVLDRKGRPRFASPGSGGYKAAQWMVDAIKQGLVPEGSINYSDTQGEQSLMAQGRAASTFSDYSGIVGTLYQVPSSSTVAGRVSYIPTPGVGATTSNLSNPDGIGIPRQAKHPKAAATFIKWFTAAKQQATFAGLDGPQKAWNSYTLPSHLSAVQQLAGSGKLAGGQQLATMLKTSEPVFPGGAPTWYPKFSNAVYTNLHAAATGSETVAQAIKAMASTADSLSSGS